jgi:peptidyl-dipeptidase A
MRRILSLFALSFVSASCTPSATPLTPSPPDPASSQGASTVPATTTPALDANSLPMNADGAKAFLADLDAGLRKVWVAEQRAAWVNENFITDDSDQLRADAAEVTMEYVGRKIKEATRFDPILAQLPPEAARQLKLLKAATTLPAPNDAKKRSELAQIQVGMQSTYGKGTYCSDKLKKFLPKDAKDNCLTLGDLSRVLEKSKNWDELVEAWKGWRTVSPPMRKPFEKFVALANEGANEIGYKDLGDLWKSSYDMTPAEFEADVERLYSEVKPLYDDLHCYTRARLRKQYGKDKIPEGAPIPAHVTGNMWAQTWGNLYPELAPYPKEASIDVTKVLEKRKLGSKKMVEIGEKFFTSLSMPPLPKTFWERSLFDKPKDREVQCHASAWDISYSNDVRIKMCIDPTEEDLITIHHELGHNYYFSAYYQLPMLFQNGANDGFHEGIGDTLALSVTPAYLVKAGLLDKAPDNEKADMNLLMRRALDKVAFLPFGMLIDKYRWDVFSGKIPPGQYNKGWWDMVRKYQGVAPPVERTEAEFDPGSKYHVPANVPYMRYFLADIYQFQFHRALCKSAGHTGPLHKCSIYGSAEAGKRMWAMLTMGASKPWPEAMKAISGETRADASAILDYFKPLQAYLKEQNKNEKCGF